MMTSSPISTGLGVVTSRLATLPDRMETNDKQLFAIRRNDHAGRDAVRAAPDSKAVASFVLQLFYPETPVVPTQRSQEQEPWPLRVGASCRRATVDHRVLACLLYLFLWTTSHDTKSFRHTDGTERLLFGVADFGPHHADQRCHPFRLDTSFAGKSAHPGGNEMETFS